MSASLIFDLFINLHISNLKRTFSVFLFPSLFFQIKNYEKTECHDERRKLAREIYDNFIMKEMLSHTHVSEINKLICFMFLCSRLL